MTGLDAELFLSGRIMNFMLLNKDVFKVIKNLRNDNGSRLKEAIGKRILLRFSRPPENPDYVLNEDWDNLVILDACRYDTFKSVNFISGDLKKNISPGTMTPEWLHRNFSGMYPGIQYISSNPWVNKAEVTFDQDRGVKYNSGEHFPDIIPVYNVESEKNTPVPESVAEEALDNLNSNKRSIIHFMQPHTPFIGQYDLTSEKTGYHNLKEKGYTDEQIKKAYRSNLERVLEAVEKILLPDLEGKTVITSDHGEHLGEYGIYGHEYGLYTSELLEVPWLEVDM